jgi:hypothetical protein
VMETEHMGIPIRYSAASGVLMVSGRGGWTTSLLLTPSTLLASRNILELTMVRWECDQNTAIPTRDASGSCRPGSRAACVCHLRPAIQLDRGDLEVNSKLAQAGSGGSGLVDVSVHECLGLASIYSTAARDMSIYGASTVHLLLIDDLSEWVWWQHHRQRML